jgi:hypothetical protein
LSAIKNSFGKLLTKDELIEQMGSFFMPEHYLALVSKMDERILSLSSEEKSSVLQYVPSSLSSRYSVLYRNLIDPFFSALLNISETEKLRVPQMAFQAILKFISNDV